MTQALITAICAGINAEGWTVVGQGGAWTKAIRPVEAYIQRRVAKAVAAEREACADLLEHGYIDDDGHHLQYAKEIRARGQA
jgi:hypothetical protein